MNKRKNQMKRIKAMSVLVGLILFGCMATESEKTKEKGTMQKQGLHQAGGTQQSAQQDKVSCENDTRKPTPQIAMPMSTLRRSGDQQPIPAQEKAAWMQAHATRYRQKEAKSTKTPLPLHPAEQALRAETSQLAQTYGTQLQALRAQYANQPTLYQQKAIELKEQLFRERFKQIRQQMQQNP
jgi:hypothetical protein